VPVKGIKVADRRSRRHDNFKTILKDNFEKVADRRSRRHDNFKTILKDNFEKVADGVVSC
jgi:hypothetical protein